MHDSTGDQWMQIELLNMPTICGLVVEHTGMEGRTLVVRVPIAAEGEPPELVQIYPYTVIRCMTVIDAETGQAAAETNTVVLRLRGVLPPVAPAAPPSFLAGPNENHWMLGSGGVTLASPDGTPWRFVDAQQQAPEG